MDTPWSFTTHPRHSAGAFAARAHALQTDSLARTVVIVGAGFSGTAVAMHLLRLPHSSALRIVLIERAQMARGTAYARRQGPYLLNVPAGRMSASSVDPLEFVAYAQRTLPNATAEDFLPRELYGQYLEASLLSAAQASPPHVRLERIHGEVVTIERARRGSRVEVYLESGGRITAHTVVLAPGNPAPAPLIGGEKLPESRYVADPWQSPPVFRAGETVLVVGTGLTMADIVLAGQETARGQATIHAISRHGLVPAAQTDFPQVTDEGRGRALLHEASVSLRRLVREVRALAEDAELRGGDWREAIAAARALAPSLWQRLAAHERKRFLRHVRSFWDVHRHRLPPYTWSALNELRREGRLMVHAGRILDLEPVGRQVKVTWRARARNAAATILVDRVVNCTGPQYDVRHTRERLLRSLLAQGMALPDPLGVGIMTDESGALLDASGRVAGSLYYIGPMLRPRYWETTAVQELRTHAEQLAHHLALQARLSASRRYPAGEVQWPAGAIA
jgi:uncharacterized NAD(P)/FAD-binding protein YdhS